MMDEPLTMGEMHCDPQCKFLKQKGTDCVDLSAKCTRMNCDLDWYDYWLAECLIEDVSV